MIWSYLVISFLFCFGCLSSSNYDDPNLPYCSMYEVKCSSEEIATLISTMNDHSSSRILLKKENKFFKFLGKNLCEINTCSDITFKLFELMKGRSLGEVFNRRCLPGEADQWYKCISIFISLMPATPQIGRELRSQHIWVTNLSDQLTGIVRQTQLLIQNGVSMEMTKSVKSLQYLNASINEINSISSMSSIFLSNQENINKYTKVNFTTIEILPSLKENSEFLNQTLLICLKQSSKCLTNINSTMESVLIASGNNLNSSMKLNYEFESYVSSLKRLQRIIKDIRKALTKFKIELLASLSKSSSGNSILPIQNSEVDEVKNIGKMNEEEIGEPINEINNKVITSTEIHNPTIGEGLMGVYYLGRLNTQTILFSYVEKFTQFIVEAVDDIDCTQEILNMVVTFKCVVNNIQRLQLKFIGSEDPDLRIIFSFSPDHFTRLCPSKGSIYTFANLRTNNCESNHDMYHQFCLLPSGMIKTNHLIKDINCCYFHLEFVKSICKISELPHDKVKCTYNNEVIKDKVKIILSSPDYISYMSEEYGIRTKFCNNNCEIKIFEKLDVICPDGVLIPIRRNNDISQHCPLSKTFSLKTFSVLVCKSTYHPYLFWFLVLWLIMGKFMINLTLALIIMLFKFLCYLKLKLKRGINSPIKYCNYCKTTLLDEEEMLDHNKCIEGKCPFCGESSLNLSSHVTKCDLKIDHKFNNLRKQMKKDLSKSLTYRSLKTTSNSLKIKLLFWVLTSIFLSTILFTPAFGEEVDMGRRRPGSVIDSIEMSLVKCGYGCWRSPSVCSCPVKSVRNKRHGESIQLSDDQIKDIDHWGVIHLDSSYSPATFDNNQEIILQQSNKLGMVTGSAMGYLKLLPDSAISWKVSSSKGDRGETFSAFIYDVEHIYNYDLEYITVDRDIRLTPLIRCTGTCDEICKQFPASRSLCQIWEKDRGWGCNPLSCWSISTGCTACILELLPYNPRIMIAVWKPKLKSINYILCINKSQPGMNCRKIESSNTLKLDGIEIITSEPMGKIDYLPNYIATVTKLDDLRRFEMIDDVYDAQDICKFKRCQFSQLGDWQTRDLRALFNSSYSESVWTSVIGASLQRVCSTGSNPVCVLDQRESFQYNLEYFLNQTNKITSEFIIKYATHKVSGNELSLSLSVLPKSSFGMIEVHLKFDDYNLLKLDQSLKLDHCEFISCTGCYNCKPGAFCNLKVSVLSLENSIIQLYSADHILLLASSTFQVTSGDNYIEFGFHTPLKESNYTICIKDTTKCCSRVITLDDPDGKLFHTGKMLHSSSNDTPTWQINDIISTVQKSGLGFYNLLLYSFSTTLKYGLLIVIFVISLVLVYYLRNVFFMIGKVIRSKFFKKRVSDLPVIIRPSFRSEKGYPSTRRRHEKSR